ncbi:hypothetical protein Tco_0058333 [Tanacetum coccineum]
MVVVRSESSAGGGWNGWRERDEGGRGEGGGDGVEGSGVVVAVGGAGGGNRESSVCEERCRGRRREERWRSEGGVREGVGVGSVSGGEECGEGSGRGPRERNIDECWWRIYKSGDLEVLES